MLPVNQIYCLDCLDGFKLIDDESLNLVITSPPYNLRNKNGKPAKLTGGGKWKNYALIDGYDEYNDALPHDQYVKWQKEILTECWRCLKPTGAIFYNHKPIIRDGKAILPTEYNPNLPIRQIIIWERAGGLNFNIRFYLPTHEWIIIFAKPDFKLKSQGASGIKDVWKFPQTKNIGHPACVDAQTECLTQNGWKNYITLTKKDVILSFNKERNCLEWSGIKDILKYNYDGEIVSINGRRLSMFLTPNHRCLVKTKNNIIKTILASKLNKFLLIPCASPNYNEDGCVIFPEKIAMFLGWFLSEGHFIRYTYKKSRRKTGIGITQSLDVNAPYVQEIEELLIDLKLKFRKWVQYRNYKGKKKTIAHFFIYKTQEPDFCETIFNLVGDDKEIPTVILKWPKRTIEIFIEAFNKGDGLKRPDRFVITQKKKENLDILAALGVILGYDISISENRVEFIEQNFKLLRNAHKSLIEPDKLKGIIWCPNLEKNGFFVARRNGKTFITGNSFPLQLPLNILETVQYNQLTIDPFVGSGTVALACKKLGLNYIGFDKSKSYCEMAEKRLNFI